MRNGRLAFFRRIQLAGAALVVLTVATVSGAWAQCGPSIHGPVTVKGVFERGDNGRLEPAGTARLVGQGVVLSNGSRLKDGGEIGTHDAIQSGVLFNAGDRPLKVAFSDGTSVDLEPGEAVTVGTAKCNCQCTCKAGTATKTALFPCSSNSDTCAYNGDNCVWADSEGVHEGTYTGCKKFWLIEAGPAQPANP